MAGVALAALIVLAPGVGLAVGVGLVVGGPVPNALPLLPSSADLPAPSLAASSAALWDCVYVCWGGRDCCEGTRATPEQVDCWYSAVRQERANDKCGMRSGYRGMWGGGLGGGYGKGGINERGWRIWIFRVVVEEA